MVSLINMFLYTTLQISMQCLTDRTCFMCSSRVNISKPTCYFAIAIHLTVSRVGLPRILTPTAMLDSKSFNTTLLEVIIPSKNEHVFILDLSDLTLPIIFNTWWASMNVVSKHRIPWNHSRHAPLWRF